MPYVDLARVAGASYRWIPLRHIVPGVVNTAVPHLAVGNLVLAEAALSFVGAGVPSPTPAWEIMVAERRGYLGTARWPTVFPGLAILLTVYVPPFRRRLAARQAGPSNAPARLGRLA